ncbi:MAG TPA: MFS transporter [Candidatus Kryptonia bacterium]
MAESGRKRISPAFWVPTLYTAEGLPFVIVNVVSVLMYKSFSLNLKSKGLPDIPDSQIALFTTLAAWPWMLKPLWGPFLEMFKTKKYFAVATQFFGGICFGLLAFSLQLPDFFKWSIVLFAVIAFNFATHDIAADGVYINSLSVKEQSAFIGWQGAFYNVGKILSQGVFVILAGYLEVSIGVVKAWMVVMILFGVLLLLISFYHMKMLPTGGAAGSVKNFRETVDTFWDVVKTFFEKKYIWWGVMFLVLYRFAEGQAIKIFPLFMRATRDQGGLGLPTEQIGLLYGIFPPLAFILGSVLSGYFTAKRGLKRSLFTLCCFFNIPFVAYAFLAIVQPTNMFVIGAAVVLEYFGYGFGFVGLTLYMMQQIAPGKYRMAHYAFATALMALGYNIPSMLSGYLSDFLGYKNFFIWVLVATIPSFLASRFVPFRVTEDASNNAIQFAEKSE